jgi:hypothetical protein
MEPTTKTDLPPADDEPSAQAELYAWFRDRSAAEDVIDTPALSDEAIERFGADLDFCRRYFRQTFRASVVETIRRSMHESRRRLRRDVIEGRPYDPADLLSRYYARVPSQGCHVRVASMTRADVEASDLDDMAKVAIVAAMDPAEGDAARVADLDPGYVARVLADPERVDVRWHPNRTGATVHSPSGDGVMVARGTVDNSMSPVV